MGLLEKALRYKKEVNKEGKDTLIDKIKGPAETEILDTENQLDSDEFEIDKFARRRKFAR